MAGTGKRVRIYIGERDKAEGHHEPLWEVLLKLLQEHGADGATMFRGLAGFGAHNRMHMARLADVLPDLPVLVEWIDGPERVERLLPHVAELVKTGTITCEDIDIVKYTHRAPHGLPPETAGEVMTQQVLAVHPDTSLAEATRMLLMRDYRALPVVDEGNRLVGIVTNNDLVQRGGLSARLELLASLEPGALDRELASPELRSKSVRDVMTSEVVSVAADERLERAAHVMVERRIKRLPVVDGERRLLGVLSRVDVLRTMSEDYHVREDASEDQVRPARTVGEAMRHDVPAVAAGAPLGEVLDAVTSTRLNRAIVIDDSGRVLGTVTDADLLSQLDPGGETGLLARLMRRGDHGHDQQVLARDVMTAPAVTTAPDAPIQEAVRLMLASRRKVLPVVDAQGALLGAVDRSDLLRVTQLDRR
jgi:CBS domain-containing protein